MSDLVYVARMLEEEDQLQARISRLATFIEGAVFDALPQNGRDLLAAQLGAMMAYHFILNQRIDRIKQES